jgi:hypothetical protein
MVQHNTISHAPPIALGNNRVMRFHLISPRTSTLRTTQSSKAELGAPPRAHLP